MKRFGKTKYIGLIFLVIIAVCVVFSITPTLGQQIPFNEWTWKHYPVDRIRYYMSDSLVDKLNTEKPNIMQVAEMLGENMMGGHRVQLGDTHITYFLMTPPLLLFGLDMYTLELGFNEDGSFQSARVVFSD
ncbi:MAG: hypothetical protein IJU08_10495 [Bacteroidales bacterium]|nr:hypothetical protein [Bacteroidales bacterium]